MPKKTNKHSSPPRHAAEKVLGSSAATALLVPASFSSQAEWTTKKCLNLYCEADLYRHLTEFLIDAFPTTKMCRDDLVVHWTRIAIGSIACLFGLYGSVVAKFPKHKIRILFCAACFFICMGLLQAFEYFVVRNSMLTCLDSKGHRRFFIRMRLDRDKVVLTTEVSSSLHKTTKGGKDTVTATVRNYLGAYFYENGILVQEAVLQDFTDAFHRCHQGHGGVKDHSEKSKASLRKMSKKER